MWMKVRVQICIQRAEGDVGEQLDQLTSPKREERCLPVT